jgi:Ca-activated chloride channel family protein
MSRIDGAIAQGGTALYSATERAYQAAQERARKDPRKIHAVVVMTDGKDESSTITLEQLRKGFNTEDDRSPVRVFTIAYGTGAEGSVLEQIAEAGRGSSAKGDVQNIVQVYRDMASFF